MSFTISFTKDHTLTLIYGMSVLSLRDGLRFENYSITALMLVP